MRSTGMTWAIEHRKVTRSVAAVLFVTIGLTLAGGLLPLEPWKLMGSIAGSMFLGLKFLTMSDRWPLANSLRGAVYLVGWPGLNAPAFFGNAKVDEHEAKVSELISAVAKTLLGFSLLWWAMTHVEESKALRTGWVGMMGLILSLHFGVMHLMSWIWRKAGLNTPPIMNAPMKAVSLAEFWSERWNRAFADVARRFVFRPLAKRIGALKAGGVVFIASGLVHELAISLPARGGWGGPTLYFALHAAGIAIERSRAGMAAGLGRWVRGWLWVFGFTVLPLPLLFHAPFVERVIVPMLEDFNLLIP